MRINILALLIILFPLSTNTMMRYAKPATPRFQQISSHINKMNMSTKNPLKKGGADLFGAMLYSAGGVATACIGIEHLVTHHPGSASIFLTLALFHGVLAKQSHQDFHKGMDQYLKDDDEENNQELHTVQNKILASTIPEEEGLIQAVYDKDLASMRWYLRKGVSANIKDKYHNTLLKIALLERNCMPAATLLLRHGADPNLRCSMHGTLTLAASAGDVSASQLLLEYNAHPDLHWPGAYTALMWHASQGQKEGVKLLLHKGANPDIQDENGDTAITAVYKSQFIDEKQKNEIIAMITEHKGKLHTGH